MSLSKMEVGLMDTLLEVRDIGISFGNNQVLRSLSFELGKNEILGIIGPNGAGKTVTLDILTGILSPTQGKIFFRNIDITRKGVTERCRLGFGRTFQIPRPFEKMTVFENVIVGGMYAGQLSESSAKVRAMSVIAKTGLNEKKDLLAGKLSLLDRKRLEIARALAGGPHVLLLDEVAGGLTESEVEELLAIVQMVKAQGISIVWIEHVLKTMREGTDRILCLAQGSNVICGLPAEVMRSREVHEVYLGADD